MVTGAEVYHPGDFEDGNVAIGDEAPDDAGLAGARHNR
jgi:hypothetical protein